MAEPELVARCIEAMKRVVAVPVTVKCRIGIDDQDPEVSLDTLARAVVAVGCDVLIVHARKAWLNGLSPKENRDIPPLDYARVYRLKEEFPRLTIVINGGIADVAAARTHCARVDGVMLGRAAYHDPFMLALIDAALFGTPLPGRAETLERMRGYIEAELARGQALKHIGRHLLGLYQGVPGARAFRRVLSERMGGARADFRVIEEALAEMTACTRAAGA
jgi:tRNA-dihydrouridine synthase A